MPGEHTRDPQGQAEEDWKGDEGGKRSVYNKVKAQTDLKDRRGQQKFPDPLHDQAGSSTVNVLHSAQGMLQ